MFYIFAMKTYQTTTMAVIRTNPNAPMSRMDVARFSVIMRRSLTKNYTKRQRQRLEERQAEIDNIFEVISKNNEEENRVSCI